MEKEVNGETGRVVRFDSFSKVRVFCAIKRVSRIGFPQAELVLF